MMDDDKTDIETTVTIPRTRKVSFSLSRPDPREDLLLHENSREDPREAWRNIDGPWRGEPDRLHWVDAATGMDCLILRAPGTGSLCGYVGVPVHHPLFGKDYGFADEVLPVGVHGGLTFAGSCHGHICHGLEHGDEQVANERVWWLGFDCAHAFDVMPALIDLLGPDMPIQGSVYRDIEYVKAEVERLAQGLGELAHKTNETNETNETHDGGAR